MWILNDATSFIIASFFAGVASLVMLGSPAMSQPSDDSHDQKITANAPGKLKLEHPSDVTITESNYQSSSKNWNVATTKWDTFSNYSGGDTKVEFVIDPFSNSDDSIKRSAKIKISSTGGSWPSKNSVSDSTTSATADPTASTTTGTVYVRNPLADTNNGFGKKPLNGEISVDVIFKHLADDQTDGGDYFAPDGTYDTTVTGTITGISN